MEWQRHESWKLVGTSTSGKHETDRQANKCSSSSSLLRRLLLLPLLNNNSAAHRTFVIKKSSTSASPLPSLSVCCVSLALSVCLFCVCEGARERASEPERLLLLECCHKREMCTRNEQTRERESERKKQKSEKRRQKLQKETTSCVRSTIINHLLINPLI
jgi:hypothetical protein